jgi:hypothetical protein
MLTPTFRKCAVMAFSSEKHAVKKKTATVQYRIPHRKHLTTVHFQTTERKNNLSKVNLKFASPWIIIQFRYINQLDAKISRVYLFSCGAVTQRGSWPSHSWGFLDHTKRRASVGRTPLDERSARCRDLYLTTHNTHNRRDSKPRSQQASGRRPTP